MRRALAVLLLLAGLAGPGSAEEEPRDDAWRAFIQQMSPEDRARAQEALDRMPPESRAKILRRLEALDATQRESLERQARGDPPAWQEEASRERLETNLRAWQELSPAEREALRKRLRSFRALPAEEQEALVESRFAGRTPGERREILGRLRTARRIVR
jgi:hypothetical protein